MSCWHGDIIYAIRTSQECRHVRHVVFRVLMASSRGVQSSCRSPLCFQRGLVGLIVITVVVYGSLLFTFWPSKLNYDPAPHTVVRYQALKGMLNHQGHAIEPMALVQINSEDDTTNLSRTQASSVSNTNWKDLSLEMLPDVGSPEALKRTATYDERGPRAGTEEQDEKTRSQPRSESAITSPKVIDLELLQEKAEEQARSVRLLPSGETRTRAFKCIGWRNTGNCDPNGPREPQKDLGCSDLVPKNASGYCEVEDTVSGERFRVMRRACKILRNRVSFRCINAPAFAKFHVQAAAATKNTPSQNNSLTASTLPRDGIVMVVYPKLVPSAFATIRALREILNCSLSIEIWFRPDEMKDSQDALVPLQKLAKDTTVGRIFFREIVDPVAKRFVAKIYAINHSVFDRVLFLDADNAPVRDPKFLFDSAEFEKTGAIFWPDFWHPKSTMFGLHSKSLLWELLDMKFVDMFEQESGQLVVDRRRHAAPLKLVLFYATHDPNFFVHYKLAWGDKDLFRLAWLKLNVSFHMIETPPAMAGMVVNGSAFCGMTMVQHDAKGDVLFLHRNKNKLTGSTAFNSNSTTVETGEEDKAEPPPASDQSFHPSGLDSYPDPAIWTHLMSFNNGWSRDEFVIQAFTTALDFTSKQKCFGRRSLRLSPQFSIQDVSSLSFAGFETQLRQFAQESTNFVSRH